MAHFHIKKKKGRPYLYVREIARVDGKPKVISQVYIGSPEKVASLAQENTPELKNFKVEEFGSLWLALQMDADIDLASLIDRIIPSLPREKGPSVGEYFLMCILNRMIAPKSKNKLAQWFERTAIQQLRPTDLKELTSQRYWEKWDRVNEEQLDEIAQCFFKHIWEIEQPSADCTLFDTTNYYTYMASQTDSKLAQRGKNKAGRHHLRQVGLGLLVDRATQLPLHYTVYPGNCHDSKHFKAIMDEMFGAINKLHDTKQRLTVIIDKGMNAVDNFDYIDESKQIHFITSYSTYFAQELTRVSLDKFDVVECPSNQALEQKGRLHDRISAYRTKGEYWGKQRSVVVVYNPKNARKKEHTLASKLETLRQELLTMREKVRSKAPHWRKKEAIEERYHKVCNRLHLPSNLYELNLKSNDKGLCMSFRKDVYRVANYQNSFGKSIIITDNMDWTTSEIIAAHLDRWKVESQFRQSKNEDIVGTQPLRHWTDSKIRCHLFSCVVALTYLRRLEIKLNAAGLQRSAQDVIDDMRHLHSVLTLQQDKRKPIRRLETPSKTQAEVLMAFNYSIDAMGVLHQRSV